MHNLSKKSKRLKKIALVYFLISIQQFLSILKLLKKLQMQTIKQTLKRLK
jgi:hypothetical protein